MKKYEATNSNAWEELRTHLREVRILPPGVNSDKIREARLLLGLATPEEVSRRQS